MKYKGVAARSAAAGVLLGVCATLGGDTLPQTQFDAKPPISEADKEQSEWQQKMADATHGRQAIAQRFAGGCAITSVVDTHTSEARPDRFFDDRGLPVGTERVPRNEVIITVGATTTTASAEAERAYANGMPDASLVQWYPFRHAGATDILRPSENSPSGFFRVPIPAISNAQKTGPNEETYTIKMYPRTDERRTTSAQVTLNTHVETYDHTAPGAHGAVYIATGRVSCGAIVEHTSANGQKVWQISPGPIPGPDFELTERVSLWE
jgi:hypothetical protein